MDIRKIMPQKKKGQILTVAIVFLMLVIASFGAFMIFKKPTEQKIIGDSLGEDLGVSGILSSCPDNGQTSVVVDVQNDMNSTGVEVFNVTLELYDGSATDPDSAPLETITSTTGATATLSCGQKYMGKILSTSGASGDSGVIISASGSGLKDVSVRDKNDAVFFTPSKESAKLVIKSQQHATQRVRVFNIIGDAFMDDNQDETATNYDSTDGVVFEDTTVGGAVNTTAVGSGATLSMRWEIQSVQTDTNLFDVDGMYVLIDAPSGVWDIKNPSATATIDGSKTLELILNPTTLSSAENIAYNDYEIIYKIPYKKGDEITSNKDLFFTLDLTALAGQDPGTADNVSVDFAPIGSYASISAPSILKIGAVDDSTARTDLHTRFDTLISIS